MPKARSASALGIKVLVLLTLVGNGYATTTVAPTQLSQTAGNVFFAGLLGNVEGGLTYQLLISEDELGAHQGRTICGVSFRLNESWPTDWPNAATSFGSYDIRLSQGVPLSSRSNVFLENVVGEQTMVRSGTLGISPQSFTTGSSPNAFGLFIAFQAGYYYSGGVLLVEVRQNNYTGGLAAFADATDSIDQGYGTSVAATWGQGYGGTSGSLASAAVTSITSVVPEPSTTFLLLAGITAVGIARSRSVIRGSRVEA